MSLAEDILIHRQICHFAMVEHVATPGNDAFMPGTDCTEVYILEQGLSAVFFKKIIYSNNSNHSSNSSGRV